MTSVIVVTKTLDAIAGSIFILFKATGTNIPNKPATIIFNTIEIEIINESFTSLNQSCTIKALINAKITPFKIPIVNSFETVQDLLYLNVQLNFLIQVYHRRLYELFLLENH